MMSVLSVIDGVMCGKLVPDGLLDRLREVPGVPQDALDLVEMLEQAQQEVLDEGQGLFVLQRDRDEFREIAEDYVDDLCDVEGLASVDDAVIERLVQDVCDELQMRMELECGKIRTFVDDLIQTSASDEVMEMFRDDFRYSVERQVRAVASRLYGTSADDAGVLDAVRRLSACELTAEADTSPRG